jgi:GT2 family glycosyltransferase
MYLAKKVSVVIPTLGGDCLKVTINQLNSGTLIPDEILICIPEDDAYKVSNLIFENTKILKTSFRGQVAQRAYGFERVSNELVLQLDDDILLKEDCLEKLVTFIENHPGSSVGPKFIERNNGKYHSYLFKDKNSSSFAEKISFYILNGSKGFQPANLSKAGLYMGIPEKPDDWLVAGWLPGGCILHQKENIVLENYYPVPGKAYWEDIFHADFLREKGVIMHRVGGAECTVDFSGNKQMSMSFFIKEFLKVLKISNLYVKKNNISPIRITIFHFYNTFNLIIRRLV